MKTLSLEVRITRTTLTRALADLRRPHPFALERAGFIASKLTHADDGNLIVLLWDYQPLGDGDYVPDDRFAAAFSGDVLRAQKQRLRDRSGSAEGSFHVHLHDHVGKPRLSRPDMAGLPPIIPCLQRAAPDAASGLLLLSRNHGVADVWLPGEEQCVRAAQVAVIGAPFSIYRS